MVVPDWFWLGCRTVVDRALGILYCVADNTGDVPQGALSDLAAVPILSEGRAAGLEDKSELPNSG
jgi:hypothetical protein